MLKTSAQRLGLILAGILMAFAIAAYDPYVGWKLKPGASGWQRHEGRALDPG